MVWNILSIVLFSLILLALVYQLATRQKTYSGVGFKFNSCFGPDRTRCHIYREPTGDLLATVRRHSGVWECDGEKFIKTKHLKMWAIKKWAQ